MSFIIITPKKEIGREDERWIVIVRVSFIC